MEKRCFIITPIGEKGSPLRKRIDDVIEVIKTVLEEKQYEAIVPHEISGPGMITNDIVKNIFESELVIANLTELNSNVLYELAARHCTCKPVITICESGTRLPFDVNNYRTIFYENDFGGSKELSLALKSFIDSIDEMHVYENPIVNAVGFNRLLVNKNRLIEGDAFKRFLGINSDNNKCIISLPYLYRTFEYGTVKCATMDEVNALTYLTSHMTKLDVEYEIKESNFRNCMSDTNTVKICLGGPLSNCETHQYMRSQFPNFKCVVTDNVLNRHGTVNSENCFLPYTREMTEVHEDGTVGFVINEKIFRCVKDISDYAVIIKISPRDFTLTTIRSTIHILFGYTAESTLAAVRFFSDNFSQLDAKYGENHYFLMLEVNPMAGCVNEFSEKGIMDFTDVMFNDNTQ